MSKFKHLVGTTTYQISLEDLKILFAEELQCDVRNITISDVKGSAGYGRDEGTYFAGIQVTVKEKA